MSLSNASELNQEVFRNIQITSQEIMIVKSLEKFYEDDTNINNFIPIINSESRISIRLIDHFVTKYSKSNKINYKIKENEVEQTFNVFTSYKQQLKAFQKKHFDPFSRGDRIPYFMGENCIITTIGQLNFFRWFFTKKVFDYIQVNQEIIENDMNKKNKNEKTKVKKDLKPKKINKVQTLSTAPIYTPYKGGFSSSLLTSTAQKTDKIIVSFTFN